MKQDLLAKGFLFTSYFSNVEYSSGYLLFTRFWIDLQCTAVVQVLARREIHLRSQAICMYKYTKIQEP